MAVIRSNHGALETGVTDQSIQPIEIDTRYAADRWRYVCPRGHIDWRGIPEGFVCLACEEFGHEPTFRSLIDRRSGEHIPRVAVRITRTANVDDAETR